MLELGEYKPPNLCTFPPLCSHALMSERIELCLQSRSLSPFLSGNREGKKYFF